MSDDNVETESTEEGTDYQMDNDEIDDKEEGFLKGYNDADEEFEVDTDDFDSDDEVER
jgi:hypothetical protein